MSPVRNRRRRRFGQFTGIAAVAVMGAIGCSSDDGNGGGPSTPSAVAAAPVAVASSELVTGDCLRGIVIGGAERRELSSVEIVPCAGTHELEVIATFELQGSQFDNTTAGQYPGIQRVIDAADDGCLARLDELGVDRGTIGLIAVWPTAQSWADTDRTVACAAFSADGTPFQRPSLVADET